MAEKKQEQRVDALIAEIFGEGDEAELVRIAIRRALGATKRVRQKQVCSNCSYAERREFTVPDAAVALKTVELLMDRLAGRPGVQKDSGGGGETFVMVNKTMLVDADGTEAIEWLDQFGLLAKSRAEVERAWTLGHVRPVEHAEFIADDEAGLVDTE